MESKKAYEKEISLQDLFWKIMLSWRRILVFALIFAILMPAGYYFKALRSYNTALTEYQKQLTVAEAGEEDVVNEEDFTAQELQQINDAKSLQSMIDRNRSYMQNSLLMNMNAYKENVLILEYYVDSDYKFNYTQDNSVNYTDAVVSAYSNYATNSKLAQQIVDGLSLDYETRYVEELISVVEDTSGSGFSLEIVYPDETALSDIATIAKEAMSSQTADFSENIGSHSLKLLSENITVRTDDELANYQQNYQNMINNYRNQLNTLKNNMTETQLEVLGVSVADEDAEENEGSAASANLAEPVKPGFSIKYLILGFLVGAFLAVLWVCAKVIFSSTLQSSEELSDLYGVRLLGCIRKEEKVSKIDEFLLKLKNRKRKKLSKEAAENILISNLELACRAENIQKIFLTGTEIEHVEKAWITAFTEKMQNVGIEVVYGENVCYSAAALRDAVEIGTAVLLEQSNQSIYDEISKEMKMLKEQNVRILGGICL